MLAVAIGCHVAFSIGVSNWLVRFPGGLSSAVSRLDGSHGRPPGFGLRCRFDHLKLAIAAAATALAAVLSAAILRRRQRPTIPWGLFRRPAASWSEHPSKGPRGSLRHPPARSTPGLLPQDDPWPSPKVGLGLAKTAHSSPRGCPIQLGRSLKAKARQLGVVEQMTIAELLGLRRREARRLAESVPSSPEWDAAMAAVEDLDEQLQTRADEVNDAASPTSSTTYIGASRDEP